MGWFGQVEFAGVGCAHMKSLLPMTGTSELLGCLSPYIPDEFINEHWPSGRTGGRRRAFSAAQLWRTHLLVLLTPTHSVNLLLELLKEQRAWRRFAHLPNRQRVPDVRMLHQFRAEVGVSGLRKINEQLARSLLEPLSGRQDTIAIMDATDLPAACVGFKKRRPAPIARPMPRLAGARLKRAKAHGLSVTKNILCDSGCWIINPPCC